MPMLSMKDWVCLVPPDELAAFRAAQLQTGFAGLPLQAALWREVDIRFNDAGLQVVLSNVDEACAVTGAAHAGLGKRAVSLSWDAVDDYARLVQLFRHEQLSVFQRIGEMTAELRARHRHACEA